MPSSHSPFGVVVSSRADVVPITELGVEIDTDAVERLDGYRVGRDEGYAAGYEAGYALAIENANQAMAGFVDGLHAAVRQVENASEVAEDRLAALAVALGAELAEAIIGGDLSLMETGEDVIVRALGLRRAGEHVRIRVHPDHPVLTQIDERPGVELVADAELGPTDALAEVGEGLVDLSIDTALERVRRALA